MKRKNMKRKVCLALGVLLLCATLTQTSRADEKRDAKIKAEMVENYLLWQVAWKNKDAARIISFESPDFTAVSKGGGVQLKQEVDNSCRETMKLIIKIYDAKVTIKKLDIESNRVVILVNHFLNADMIGPEERSYRVLVDSQSRDIWVNYDGAWMLKRSEEIDTKFMVDGKPER
jgi:ketosteroid isomerase-like protein